MHLDDYKSVAQDLIDLAASIEARKRPSYTGGDSDVLRNFKRDAAEAGISPLQNWHTHFLKQVAAINRWARTPTQEQSEPIEQRFADLINYCKLGLALKEELYASRRDGAKDSELEL